MARTFASLDEDEALQVAIRIEERNARLYEDLARRLEARSDAAGGEVVATLREMAEQERAHAERLEERYRQRFGDLPATLTATDILEVIEVPALNEPELSVPGRASRETILEAALAAERHAREYYTELARLTLEAPTRGLYQELASFEREHEEFLEKSLAEWKLAARGA
jgi:rubrerythrin